MLILYHINMKKQVNIRILMKYFYNINHRKITT